MRLFAGIFQQVDNMSEVQIIFLCRTISIIRCAQEGPFLIIEIGVMKKKCMFVSASRPHEQKGFRVSRGYD